MARPGSAFTRLNNYITGLLLFILAVLMAWLSSRYSYVTDWTDNGRHTLSEASQTILTQMPDRIEVTAYARESNDLRSAITRFIDRYQRIKSDIVLHFVNPDAVPDEIRELGVSNNGEMVIYYQGRKEHVRTGSEEEFTNALQRLLREKQRWLAYIEGHGERSPLGKANHDISEFSNQLSSRGFHIQPINLATMPSVPDNTTVLIIAGPLVDYLPEEVTIILNYVQGGGSLLWLGEPNNLHGLDPLAKFLGIEFPQGTAIDISGQMVGINEPTVVLITEALYGDHAALNGFDYTTLFPRTAAITGGQTEDWTMTDLLTTGELSWLEKGPLKGEVNFDRGIDIQGPLSIAVSLERQGQRIIVTGDGDFLSNSYIGNSGNMELGLRLINWLSSDDDFISIPAGLAEDTQLEMSRITAGIIGFGFLIILPTGLLLTGGYIWWRRKNL